MRPGSPSLSSRRPGSRSRPRGSSRACSLRSRRLGIQRGLARGRQIDEEIERAKAELAEVARTEVSRRSGELERTLARARADSLSAYAEEERRLAETRRTALGESEQRLRNGLAEAFSKVQGQVEQRLASWHQDLDRAQSQLGARLEEIAQRERSLIEALEARLESDGERVNTVGEEQKAAVNRLREDLARTAAEVAANARPSSRATRPSGGAPSIRWPIG